MVRIMEPLRSIWSEGKSGSMSGVEEFFRNMRRYGSDSDS
jgi:hypothetical protein